MPAVHRRRKLRRLIAGTAALLMYVAGISGTAIAAPPSAVPGAVSFWGADFAGQNMLPDRLANATAISSGAFHSLAIRYDGTVVAWGSNGYGQSTVPAGLSGVSAIAAGGVHSLALMQDGTVTAWGGNGGGQENVPVGLSGVIAISAGSGHSLAVKADGTVAAWGTNTDGQASVPDGLTGVKAVVASTFHSLALKEDGTVVGWGDNGDGQSDVPSGLTGVKAIAEGASHSLALKEDGTVVAWGNDESGQATVPADLSDVRAIAAGGRFSLALKDDGTAVAWGNNENGQTNVPSGLAGATTISAGSYHSLAIIPAVPPAFTADSPPTTATAGQAYAGYSFAATGTPAPTFSLIAGTLPDGITLTPGGRLAGTPTKAGNFSFVVQADNGAGPGMSGIAHSLVVAPGAPAEITLTLGSATLTADGASSTQGRLRITDSHGNGVRGQNLVLSSTDPGQDMGTIADLGDGDYGFTLTSSNRLGSSMLSASLGALSVDAAIEQVAGATARVTVLADPASLPADGTSTSILAITLTDATGHPIAGEIPVLSSTDSGHSFTEVADQGDCSYTTTLTASRTAGTSTVTVEIQLPDAGGESRSVIGTAVVTQTAVVQSTVGPTMDPTVDPTVDPAVDPTVDPTGDPTVVPSAGPSTAASGGQTVVPTADPTVNPTIEPTTNPTGHPTGVPSVRSSTEGEATKDDGLAVTGIGGIGGIALGALLLILVGAGLIISRQARRGRHS